MRKLYYVLFISLFAIITTEINAQIWTQIGSDINGEADYNYSGKSVSLSSDGTIVAIGAPENDGIPFKSGHVRIYQNNNGTWTQIGEDIDGEASGDESGTSVSLSSDGSVVAIGAPKNDNENGGYAGQVRIYENISGTWTQIGSDIDGEVNGDYSGSSVSLSSDGSIVAIGARYNNGNASASGHVRIYQNIDGTWTQIGADIDGKSADDYFGSSVSLSSDGSIIAIGATDYEGFGGPGYVQIYENISGTWTQIGSDIEGEASGDGSGGSVSLNADGSIIAIGAGLNDGGGNYSGHVRIYQYIEGIWTQVGSDIDGESEGDLFANVSLSKDGSIVAIGGRGCDVNGIGSGQVKVYKNIEGEWNQIGFAINGQAAFEYTGTAVSLSHDGSVLAIGSDGANSLSGKVSVYRMQSNTGIKDLAELGISVYPNPTNGFVKLIFAENHVNKLKVLDITGKTVFEETEVQQNETIDLSNYSTGIYVITVETEKGSFTSKIIKE